MRPYGRLQQIRWGSLASTTQDFAPQWKNAAGALSAAAQGAADATFVSSRTEREVNAAPDAVPTDTLYADQWHFDFMGNGGGRGYIETIWNEYSGAGVHVGIYDSGVQSTHPDLDGNYDTSLHVVIDDVAISGETPTSPHGTAVAGIIGAEKDNGGVVGIAWGASLTSVNIFDPASAIFINAADFSDFLLAVRQMANFDVVNNSWGAYPGFFSTGNLLDSNSFTYKPISSLNTLSITAAAGWARSSSNWRVTIISILTAMG